MSTQVILGVDIGTTSVKVCLIDAISREELSSESKDTQSNIPAGAHHPAGAHEQNVRKIVSTLHNCILRLPKEHLKHVKHIGICGQMHGIVFWKCPAWTDKFELVNEHISNLITWQDTRCDHAYLATLPRPDSHLRAYTGYGVNTLLWYLQHEPHTLSQYTHAATIQDFIVAMLCDLQEPIMSNQNAASWGYFNCKLNSWNENILRKHAPEFPLNFLPKIVPSGTIVGTLTRDWLGIPKDTPIHVALGDLQCSVLATLERNTDAIINISTSAQIAFIDESFVPNDHYVNETEKLKRNVRDTHYVITGNKTEEDIVSQTNKIETNATLGKSYKQSNTRSTNNITNSEIGQDTAKTICDKDFDKTKVHDLGLLNRIGRKLNDTFRETFNNLKSEDVGYDEVDPIRREGKLLEARHTQVRNEQHEATDSEFHEATDSQVTGGLSKATAKFSEPTDSQLMDQATLLKDLPLSSSVKANHIEHFPYFDGKYIAVGASMNGGNCLATFICTLQNWFKEFGFNVPQNQIWSKLINAPESLAHISRHESDLVIIPTLLGDRHVTQESASIFNITAPNLNIHKMFIALCKGIIRSLTSIMNRDVIHESGITRIIGIGSCLTRNHILEYYIESMYELKVFIERQRETRDASYGAAISTLL